MNNTLNDSVRTVMDSASQEEFRRYRRAAAEVMGDLYLHIVQPILHEHPGLTPPELRDTPPEAQSS